MVTMTDRYENRDHRVRDSRGFEILPPVLEDPSSLAERVLLGHEPFMDYEKVAIALADALLEMEESLPLTEGEAKLVTQLATLAADYRAMSLCPSQEKQLPVASIYAPYAARIAEVLQDAADTLQGFGEMR
jgi:hypothetical protein